MNRKNSHLSAAVPIAALLGSVACGSAPDAGEPTASTGEAMSATSVSAVSVSAVSATSATSATSTTSTSTSTGSGSIGVISYASCQTNYAKVCTPGYICACSPEIQVETGAPAASGTNDPACTVSAPIEVPPELEGHGCTLGVVYNSAVFGGDQRFWACPVGTPVPASIAWPGGEGVSIWAYPSFYSHCIGEPDAGWEFIVQNNLVISETCGGGCPGQDPGNGGTGTAGGSSGGSTGTGGTGTGGYGGGGGIVLHY